MKETVIRKKAIYILEKQGYFCWYPKKAKFQETDIFGVFDILAGRKSDLRFIQITTLTNISARKKKVSGFMERSKVQLAAEVWGYNKKKKVFRIDIIEKYK